MKLQLLQVRDASNERIRNPQDVVKLMREEGKADREAFWVLHLNTHRQLILKELVSLGTINVTSIHAREIFKRAIVNGSDSIVTVHNHPSGNIRPSKGDKRVWNCLTKAGKIIGIPVEDNFIITPKGEYYCTTIHGRG